jgi:hypothetical protein
VSWSAHAKLETMAVGRGIRSLGLPATATPLRCFDRAEYGLPPRDGNPMASSPAGADVG